MRNQSDVEAENAILRYRLEKLISAIDSMHKDGKPILVSPSVRANVNECKMLLGKARKT